MLTKEQEEIISTAMQPLFQYLEHEVIVDLANRIKESLSYTRKAELQAIAMRELGYSPAKIRREAMKLLKADEEFRKMVALNTLQHKRTVKKMLEKIQKEAYKANSEIMSGAGNMAYADDLSVWKDAGKTLTDDSYLSQLVKAFAKQTEGELKNLTQTTGFKTMSGFESMENLYRRELDKALIKVCSGTFSKEKVIKDTVHELAQSGLRTIDFESGYSMQLDTAVRLAMRTGAHQLSGKIMDKNMEQTGENLVYVSKHWGARNTGEGVANHENWQGKVYYIKDGTDYSEEAKRIGQDRIVNLWYATGYSVDGVHENNPLGMYGYNCRHRHYVWFLGISSLPDEQEQPKPVTIDGKTYDYYAVTQKMRSMERSVRALKREKEALGKLGMDTKEIDVKIKRKVEEYQNFCEKCNVKEKTERMRYECGTSDLKKTKAWKEFKESEEGTVNADYLIRNHEGVSNTTNERITVNNVISKMPIKVQSAIQAGTIVDVGKDGSSQYDYNNDILYISKGATEKEIVHEIGHVVENKIIDTKKVEKLREKFIQNVSVGNIVQEIYYDSSRNPVEIFLLKDSNFVSEYQGRLYVSDWSEIYDENWNIKPELLQEFMSEPFREYIENPKRLESEFPQFYKLIKEAVE